MSVVPGFEWLQPVLGLNSVKGGGVEKIYVILRLQVGRSVL